MGALALAASCTSDPAGTAPTSTATTATSASGPATSGPTDSTTPTSPAGTTTTSPPRDVPRYVDEHGFDDHSVPAVTTVDDLLALARTGVGAQAVVKFVLPEFDLAADDPAVPRAHLMDGGFYDLHDEWYWFRLLNGQPIAGLDVAPVDEHRFGSIAEIRAWARAQPARGLPLDLEFVGDGRLYSPAFYAHALHDEPRTLGVGSIVRFPTSDGEARWLLELEYTDEVTPEHVAQFFERLEPVLPPEVASSMVWVVRSPQQDEVATQMIADRAPFHDRIVRYADLVPPGEVQVYSEGVTAGRLLYVGEGGADLADATPTDIVLTEHVPDWLPQAAALITSDPQTPLAHVNLLARNRRIPNASLAGLGDDAGLRQAARVRATAIVIARDGELRIALIDRDQYARWTAAAGDDVPPMSLPPVDTSTMPLVVDLTELTAELAAGGLTTDEIDAWVPVIGGKSAGFLTLLSTPGLTPPPDPLAITVRAYLEHVAPLRPTLEAVLDALEVEDDPRARWLVLEGDDDYADVFGTDDDAAFADTYVSSHPAGTPLGDVLDAGGVREFVEDAPIDRAMLDEIVDELEVAYAGYAVTTGLRFRSSSSVEDVEGFNGAGLYTSYTGFLDAEAQPDEGDRNNTIERAIRRAWASYWGFEAFEERRAERIDHLSGAMGLTVHARFDDDLERNNGVATFTYLPAGTVGAPRSDDAELEINVQQGAVEVTNPDPDRPALPEVIVVRRVGGDVTIERRAGSTLVAPDEQVLDDEAVRELFDQVDAVASGWRDRLNAGVEPAQQVQTVVLDVEFKTMEAGWPAVRAGEEPLGGRLVLRQVRSLDPGLRRLPEAARSLPVPLDVLMRASEITAGSCTGASGRFYEGIVVFTDPALAPDMGFADTPWQQGDALPNGSACESTRVDVVRYASPDRMLVSMVDGGQAFVIVGA